MKLFIPATVVKIDFDLRDVLRVIEDFWSFEYDTIRVELHNYSYQGVKGDVNNVNPTIISFLGQVEAKILDISYIDFVQFSEFIGQTEDGFFRIFSNEHGLNLSVEVYDCYFWSISSEDVSFIKDMSRHRVIQNFEFEII